MQPLAPPPQPLGAATCSHLLPSSGCKWLQVSARGCKWLPEQVAASIRKNLEKKAVLTKLLFFQVGKWLASGCKCLHVAASGCPSKWLPLLETILKKNSFDKTAFFSSWQVAASGCKWLQVAASGCKWLQVAALASGCKWLQGLLF